MATLLISAAVYLVTLAPDLTWANASGDGGELITASYTLGVPHPPGYPTYTLLGKVFSFLPLGTVAWRYNLFSAMTMALAAFFVTAAVVTVLGRPGSGDRQELAPAVIPRRRVGLAGIIAGLFFALCPLVWQQAIITEVYALNALFASLVLLVVIHITTAAKAQVTRWPFVLVGLFLGLAVTAHLTSLLLLPLVLILLRGRGLPFFMAGLALGLLPYLALPRLGQSTSPVRWGTTDTLEGWWWLVSARLYRPNVLGLPLSDWGPRLAAWSRGAIVSFGWSAFPLIAAGSFALWRTDHRKLVIAVLLTAALYGLYAFTYATHDAYVFLVPAVLLLSILLGFGAGSHPWLGLSLLLLLVALNLPSQRLGQTSSVRLPAEQLLRQVPAEAILLTPGDQTIATLWYFHHVEGKRPDLIIIDGNLFQFDWYRQQIADAYPDLRHLAEDDLDGFRRQNGLLRPICDLSLVIPDTNQCLSGN